MARNILLITSDQQHWNTLGCLNPGIETPALDRLAAEGTLFTRAYCPNPTCTPTRASIITGKYPSQHGGWTLGTKLPESEPTIGDLLLENDIRTALVGKAHFQQLQSTPEFPSLESYPIMQDLDFWRRFKDRFYGFEHVELARNHADEAHVGQHYAIWMEEKGCLEWRQYFQKPTGTSERQRHHWPIPEAYHYDAWIAERTNALLEQYAGGGDRFFLWASFFDPHPPYLVPSPWDTMYDPNEIDVPGMDEGEHEVNPPHFGMTQEERPDFSSYREPGGNGIHGCHSHRFDPKELARDTAIYYGMVSCMDKYIGRIVDRLDALGLAEDTLVVFTTDHGHFLGQHGLMAKGPFHYEDMLKIPFIVRQPGTVPAGQRSDALQSLVDLAPTFLTSLGLPVPDAMTGLNQLGVWSGQQEYLREHVVTEFHHNPTTIHLRTYIEERWKLTVYCNQPYGELFDLGRDPDEKQNRWDDNEYLDVKRDLHLRLLIAGIEKEEPLTPEALKLPQKSAAMYVKSIEADGYRLRVDPDADTWELVALQAPDRNLWDDPALADTKADLVRRLLFQRLAAEPIWMPRVCSA